jgi:uncharacterized protein YkwD
MTDRARNAAEAARALPALALVLGAAVAGCGVSIPALGGRPGGDPMPTGSGGCPATLGEEVLERVNRDRSRHGLPPLAAHAALARAASVHSADQAAVGRLNHTGSDGSSVADRVQREGYRWSRVGENVGGGYAAAADVVAGWMNSPGHRAVMLTPGENHAGVGYSRSGHQLRHFWTLVVAQPAADETEPAMRCHP